MRKLGFPNYAIVLVNFIQTMDKASILKLIAVNLGASNKYVLLLIYLLPQNPKTPGNRFWIVICL